MIDRRSFLSALIATATLDPEKLLWIPGQKDFSFPDRPLVPKEPAVFDRTLPPGYYTVHWNPKAELWVVNDGPFAGFPLELKGHFEVSNPLPGIVELKVTDYNQLGVYGIGSPKGFRR